MKKLVFLLLAISLLLVSCGNDNNTDSSLQGTNTEAPREEENSYPPASNFNMKDIHGRELKLSDLASKPIVLNFWASWCPPCKAELPDFEEAYRKYGNDINFVMLSVDETIEEAMDIVSQNSYTFPVYHDYSGAASYYYNVESIPRTYFISPTGYIIASHESMISANQLEACIQELIKKGQAH